MRYLKYVGLLALTPIVAALVGIALGGMAVGMWVSMHWDLKVEDWGFWAVLGGFVAQIGAIAALVVLVCYLEDRRKSPAAR